MVGNILQPWRVNWPNVNVVLEKPATASSLDLPQQCPWAGPDIFGADTRTENVFGYVKHELGVPRVGWLKFDCEIRGPHALRQFQPMRKLLFLSEDRRLGPLLSSLQGLQGRLFTEDSRVVERVIVRPRLDLIPINRFPVRLDLRDKGTTGWPVVANRSRLFVRTVFSS